MVGGSDPAVGGWVVAVADPNHPDDDLTRLRLDDGAVTTSARTRRRWETAVGEAHHLLDPRTGRPAASGLAGVTVVAGSAAWGEVHAKAALVAGPTEGVRLVEAAGLCAILVTDDGHVLTAGPLDDYLVEPLRNAS